MSADSKGFKKCVFLGQLNCERRVHALRAHLRAGARKMAAVNAMVARRADLAACPGASVLDVGERARGRCRQPVLRHAAAAPGGGIEGTVFRV